MPQRAIQFESGMPAIFWFASSFADFNRRQTNESSINLKNYVIGSKRVRSKLSFRYILSPGAIH